MHGSKPLLRPPSPAQDESGGAAIYAAQLDEALGGTPTQFRQAQGQESDDFTKVGARTVAPTGPGPCTGLGQGCREGLY